jgi:non-canonical (house-cleaning) NTP pyrophosphatase
MRLSEITPDTKLDTPLVIGVAGTSKIKVDATRNAIDRLNLYCGVISVAIGDTGTNEQPCGYIEIYEGARKRARMAKESQPEHIDVYLGIENGIDLVEQSGIIEPDTWIDYAIIYAIAPGGLIVCTKSDNCVFPTGAVLATRQLPGGFKKNTVGKYMAEQKIVSRHDNPHIDLCQKSRVLFLEDAVFKALLHIFPKMRQ